MKRRNVTAFGARHMLAPLLVSIICSATSAQNADAVRSVLVDRVGDLSRLQVPDRAEDFPQPELPDGSLDPRFLITPEKVRLGKLLMFDPIRSNEIRPEYGGDLGTTHTASCGSCHLGEAASKSGLRTSMGVGGEGRHRIDAQGDITIERRPIEGLVDVLPTPMEIVDENDVVVVSGRFDAIDSPARVAPSIIGFAFNNRLLWGGEAGEENAEGYPAQEHVVRLASRGHRLANEDTSELQAIPAYVRLFELAFPSEATRAEDSGDLGDLVSLDTQFRAIAAFCRTVMTHDTPWDRLLAGDDNALTPRQLRGAWLFASTTANGGANCIACHSGPALNKRLGDEEGLLVEENFDNLGSEEHPLFQLARDTIGDPEIEDTGRESVTLDPNHAFAFKSPTLRQLKDAAPYFHGGELTTLEEVVEYFNAGEAVNPRARDSENFSELFARPRGEGTRGLGLSKDDVDALVDFLDNGLHDEGFVQDIPGSRTSTFELNERDLTYSQELLDLGARNGWLPSGLPNGFNDELSRSQIVFVRGNVNDDEVIDMSDAVAIFGFLFLADGDIASMVASDVNDDGSTDIADGVYLLNWLFRDGPQPVAPFPAEGQDLTR